ncbi:hypothetical protein [Bradyrhizobium sp. sGM-13]|uniref:hypothetical protein n=1 Tax=Bradyrhizobium sp. sGM-13 TaxID=2831781 RepID=UPI001BCC553F|nr:hypothetical protein [Bradyrhizobium sp. sGM-13]
MTTFLRLLADKDKASSLLATCKALRTNSDSAGLFEVSPESFRAVPGAPFAYWVSEAVRQVFANLPALENEENVARQGGVNGDDFRWLRLWLEQSNQPDGKCTYVPVAKGGAFGTFYGDLHLVARWNVDLRTFHSFNGLPHRPSLLPASAEFYFRPGLTWPRRTNGLSFRMMPRGCIFADKGPAVFVAGDKSEALLSLCAIVNSKAFGLLVSVQLARTELAQSFEVGLIQQTPVPEISTEQQVTLSALARRAWTLKQRLDTVEETSHAFLLPSALRARLGDYDPPAIEEELVRIQAEINAIAFDLYGFSGADRVAAHAGNGPLTEREIEASETVEDDAEDEDSAAAIDQSAGLLSWAVGVPFARFDWRLATGERSIPPEPEPFDPLPTRSPGMLPEGAAPFHTHPGILVDDSGHPHDLARLVEEVLARVEAPVPSDVRRWLQRDFFPFHLQRYSKSRRKAPIYWPLSTASGSYTLWLYYPSLTSQTLYTAVNDFIEPKLKQVGQEVATLRNKGGARTREDEKSFEALQSLDLELIELRDVLLQIAPTYRLNHDDGIQITAAPLWPLFRHKPWQKLLKDTWAKLAKGDYDWTHLAMANWPDRVREKCKTDKSLAMAHGLEELYVEPEPKNAKKRRGAK